jgi:hypothetical protein
MGESPHPSNSSVNLDIEKEVVKIISEKENIDFKTGEISIELDIEKKVVKVIHNKKNVIDFETGKSAVETVKFNFDFHFFSEKINIIGEVYSRTDNVKGSVEGKIAKDCLKLLCAEKLLDKPCCKRLVFIDKKVKNNFFENNKWITKAINEFGIHLEVIEVSEQKINQLKAAKKSQQLLNQRK